MTKENEDGSAMKWQGDSFFCSWLVDAGYAYYDEDSKLKTHISTGGGGITIYMWEAWTAGTKKPRSEDV
tara:strand:+ start:746 stop:952 length:207 start_codon:yes stop_codon:yes gene_type:complete